MKLLSIFLGVALVAGIVAALTQEPTATVQGQIFVTIKTNVFDVMKTENEKQETVKVSEVKSIRFTFENTLFEVPFASRDLFESVTNLVKSETWSPKLTVPPIPPAQNFQLRTATRVEPLPSNYGPQGPRVPAPHPDIPR